MAILEVGAHIGGIGDEVVNRMRPATNLLIDAARASSSYVDRLLHSDDEEDETAPKRRPVRLHAVRTPRDDVGRRPGDVIVPRFVTRC
ncbi:hypothetical protein [Mycolicibacterium sediminis]|uniref:Uncharacterized protein n=1 Tax=Mycolicibacterium sediminis TaxID=1286180 RepID=A0A7I7QKN4_9MYCO|nr:hypothetical protein [Mycolicibacterium sediminis]BBY26842.1 hypothetical protein MSEDJ_09380 [Mycolicibacterium sediminis]